MAASDAGRISRFGSDATRLEFHPRLPNCLASILTSAPEPAKIKHWLGVLNSGQFPHTIKLTAPRVAIRRKRQMKLASLLLTLLLAPAPALAQNKSGVEKLYIINCGEGVAGDLSRWTPGLNVGKQQDFVDNCYLIKHGADWLIWDTGITDAVAAMPAGQPPADPRAVTWRSR
jgi:hypothetical protein